MSRSSETISGFRMLRYRKMKKLLKALKSNRFVFHFVLSGKEITVRKPTLVGGSKRFR